MSSEECCKVSRVTGTYDLDGEAGDGMDDRLLSRWTGTDGHASMGYRTLTTWFNKRLLRRVYEDHGLDTLGGRIDHDYEALVGDDELRTEDVLERLRSEGVDADAVLEDMVSWGTMRTHLLDCLGGEKDTTGESDWERESIAMARSFAREKAESALSALETKGDLAGVDAASVSVSIRLSCDHCPTRVPFDVALDRGYVCERHSDADTVQTEGSP